MMICIEKCSYVYVKFEENLKFVRHLFEKQVSLGYCMLWTILWFHVLSDTKFSGAKTFFGEALEQVLEFRPFGEEGG